MHPFAAISVPSPTVKGRRSSSDDGSKRPDSCSAPSKSAGCTRVPCCRLRLRRTAAAKPLSRFTKMRWSGRNAEP
eukprot:scaffold250610_cov30-Tisochrysis_lutea.AAC.4